RGWVWLAWLALGGAVLWAVVAMVGASEAELLWPMGLYLLALPLLFLLVTDAVGEAALGVRHVAGWTASSASALLMLGLVQIERSDTVALDFALVLSATFVALAWRFPRVDRLAWIGALLQVAVAAAGRRLWPAGAFLGEPALGRRGARSRRSGAARGRMASARGAR